MESSTNTDFILPVHKYRLTAINDNLLLVCQTCQQVIETYRTYQERTLDLIIGAARKHEEDKHRTGT